MKEEICDIEGIIRYFCQTINVEIFNHLKILINLLNSSLIGIHQVRRFQNIKSNHQHLINFNILKLREVQVKIQ